MKKILFLILTLALFLMAFTSCGLIFGEAEDDDTTDDTTDDVTEDTPFDSSMVKLISRTFVYDGNTKAIGITGSLPDGVIVEYIGNDQTEVGTYTVTAKFYEDGAYLEGEDLTSTLTINPCNYNMSVVAFSDESVVYTGEAVTPSVSGALPEGVSVEYVYDGEIKNVGTYEVTAVFTGDSNHNPIGDMTAVYTVTPASYDMTGVYFDGIVVEYTGEAYSISITGDLPEGVTVTYRNNGQSSVGEHVVEAVFESSDPNYAAPATMSATITVTPEIVRPVTVLYNLKDDDTYEVVGYTGEGTNLIIPALYRSKSVTSIKSGAFEGNTNIKSVSLPVSLVSIGNKAFKDCSSITSVNIRSELQVIGYQAFAGTSITSVALPDSLVSIGQGAFKDTPLESITLPFIGGSRDSSNAYLGYLFGASSYAGNAATVPSTLKSVTMTDGAERIPAFAFFGISSIDTVTLGEGLSFIGNSAFVGTSLKSIYLPAGVTAVPADADVTNSPFFGLGESTVIMLESVAGEGFGRYWNSIGEGSVALTVYMKTYDYYLNNKDNVLEADMSSAKLSGIVVDGSLVSGFDSDTLEYSGTANINVGYPGVVAVPDSPLASFTVEQATASNGGVATITVVSADNSATLVYRVRFTVTGTFTSSSEVVGKDGTTGTVTFVVDDGDHATAEFTASMMNKYDGLTFTYAILTNKLATLDTVYNSSTGKYNYVIDGNGRYAYTANTSEVAFWNDFITRYGAEVISHTYTHAFWGINDDGGVQKYVDSNGNVKTSGNLPVGSTSAEVYASLQIIEDLLGIRAITHTEAGIGVMTTDTTVGGVLYKTYNTYYQSVLNEAIANGDIVNYIGNVMGASATSAKNYVTKDNIKNMNGIARMMVRPTDNKELWKQFIDNAAANDGWATYCIHKITPEASSGHYILESDAEELFAHAASKNVWIANYTEAALYYTEWASAEVSTTYADGKIRVTLTDSEDNTVYNEALTVKVYVPATWDSAVMNGETLTVHTDADGSFVYANIVPDSGIAEITPA